MLIIFLMFYFFLIVTLFIKALPDEDKEKHGALQTNFIIGTVFTGILVAVAIFTG